MIPIFRKIHRNNQIDHCIFCDDLLTSFIAQTNAEDFIAQTNWRKNLQAIKPQLIS